MNIGLSNIVHFCSIRTEMVIKVTEILFALETAS
jgi:hypothetical protein